MPPRREHGALGAALAAADDIDLLVIENVGNLVCPAEFRVGEDARIMVCSVTEGEDKPLKYPLMFRACELVVINKIDLLEHLDFDLDRLLANLDAVHPGVPRVLVSARTGEGVDGFREWLVQVAGRARGRRVTGRAEPPPRAAPASQERLAQRTEANERFFAAEAERIARLCHRMAERFAARRAARWPSGPRRPRAPTPATSRSSSSTP